MNCLEFRRAYTSEPNQRAPDFLEHKRSCVECAAFAQRMSVFETGLEEAIAVDIPDDLDGRIMLRRSLEDNDGAVADLTDARFEQLLEEAVRVDVPENLDSRIVLRQSIHQHKVVRTRWSYGLAMAASLLAVVGVVSLVQPLQELDPLSRELVAHVSHDRDALRATSPIQHVSLNSVLQPIGASMAPHPQMTVTYAAPCVMAHEQGAHIVVADVDGPVTIMLLPKQEPDPEGGGKLLKSGPYSGIVVPAGRGSMAVFAPSEDKARNMANQFNKALSWTL